MLLLGTVAPVPHDLKWQSNRLKRMLAGVGEVIMPPRVKMKLGFFARIAAVTSAPGKTSYPDDKTLGDTLPDTVYRDVVLANQQFNHGDPALLHYRPGFAAYMLRKGMLRSMHLDGESPLYDYLRTLGHHHDARIVKPVYSVKVTHPRDFVRHITGEDPGDVACLSTLAHLLAHRSGELNVRAQAWADGDSSGVRAANIKAFSICNASLHPEQNLARHGVIDLSGHMRAAWITAIVGAVHDHRLSVAALPVHMLLGSDGYLAALRQHGFVLSGPTLEKAANDSGAKSVARF